MSYQRTISDHRAAEKLIEEIQEWLRLDDREEPDDVLDGIRNEIRRWENR